MTIEQMINDGATIVDVRTPSEFMGANVPGSINIPLNEVPQRIEEFKNMDQPLLLCCMSGNRSGQASNYLSLQGIACANAGSWLDVNHALAQKAS